MTDRHQGINYPAADVNNSYGVHRQSLVCQHIVFRMVVNQFHQFIYIQVQKLLKLAIDTKIVARPVALFTKILTIFRKILT